MTLGDCIYIGIDIGFCVVLSWIGLDWVGLGWIGLDWDWVGLDWIGIGLDWDWIGLDWGWVGFDCVCIGRYMSDERAAELPSEHPWNSMARADTVKVFGRVGLCRYVCLSGRSVQQVEWNWHVIGWFCYECRLRFKSRIHQLGRRCEERQSERD